MDIMQKQVMGASIASLFQPLIRFTEMEYPFEKETHVTERFGVNTDAFEAIVYCEDQQCAFKIFYDSVISNPLLTSFLKKRAAINTNLVTLVFNMFQSIADEEYMEIHKVRSIWEKVRDADEEHTLIEGVVEESTLGKKENISYFRFDAESDETGEVILFMGVDSCLVNIYEKHDCYYDAITLDSSFFIRIQDKERNQLAVLKVQDHPWMTKEEYSFAVENNHIWEKK